jgi:hypothetical protein
LHRASFAKDFFRHYQVGSRPCPVGNPLYQGDPRGPLIRVFDGQRLT